MNAEQKQQAQQAIEGWRSVRNDDPMKPAGDVLAALLQELVDAPEPEPVARVTGYYAGYLSIATVDGRVLPAGTALYTAPQPPQLSDERIDELIVEHLGIDADDYAALEFARAVEREILGGTEK